MSIDKSWTTNPYRNHPELQAGLKAFIEKSKSHLDSNGKIRCACEKCDNRYFKYPTAVERHIFINGFSKAYKIWIYHGESFIPPVVLPSNEMADLIDDVMWESRENDTNLDERTSNIRGSGVDDDFAQLLEEMETQLYNGCIFSSLEFLAKLMHIKVNNKWTDSSFDQLLELLQLAFPKGNKKEHDSLQVCPVCKESRWIDKNTKGKKVPHKVLRYFPVTPRLRRLYCSRHTAKNMIWHSNRRSEDGVMIHPVDGEHWQDFDKKYPDFSSERRNVRLGLSADGFNPFGNMCNPHSTWPVILTTYNLPPWLCMKESSFMLTLLIPGPKAPGKDMDVFLRPLVEELKHLWNSGVRIKDAATNTFFTMRAMLLWTINDWPARSSLSGWSGQGYKACATCNEDTPSYRATNKVVYIGHRRFLDANDPLRKRLDFNGMEETRLAPRHFSNDDIQEQLGRLLTRKPGKHPEHGGGEPKRQDYELNWSKRSIFFELEYWSSLQLKHNIDVMHVQKNVDESLLGVKLPDGFGSNISKKVNDTNTNIIGLKSHDHHILMQRLIPIGVRGLLDKDTYTPIVDLCMFFKQLCSRTLKVEDMRKEKVDIIAILCKLELIYPPAFFDIMVHLLLHLPDEAIAGGPVCMRWMFPFERYMKKLKNNVRNKAKPEGSIVEGYVAEEALSFCSMYLRDVKNRPERNVDVVIEKTNCEEVRQYIKKFKSEHPQSDEKREFQKSPEFHKELSVLAMGPQMNAYSYTACIVNGVRFMVLSRDTQRTTQNSGVLAVGEKGEKYYGQLEEIIELRYTHDYSTVLFRCKWFDTRTGVISSDSFTSIDTQREAYKDDQLIYASQAKQVFYIREPNNNHRCVVEHVNHRSIWDLPSNDDLVQNVDNVSHENVDDVDFQNIPRVIVDVESASEVPPPTGRVNDVSDCEIDYDDTDSDYDTEEDTEGYEEDSD
ncbi:uncharacterized protein LOC111902535 [Lactuca sativa]|uniref:uncharacterized protein LOC111902535 n=1 Tax=Lactuca sativa TaxID=4236 RepID=UPI0022AEA6A4|nr:uncharacterized protein LOC111902535 [Lactuca sativa]